MGVGIGAVAAVLFAPRSGAESRQYLQDRANEGADYLKRQGEELANSANEMLDRGSKVLDKGVKVVRHHKENVMAAVNAGRDAFREGVATTPESDYKL